ncbi:Qat anti-phage system associated protein QatB [Desulfovibrio intestinalis]
MGTSKCYGGPSNGLIPPFVDDPQPSLVPQSPTGQPSLPGDPALPVSYPTQPQIPNTTPQTPPRLPDTDGAGKLRGARSAFSRYCRSGDRAILGRALSNYVRKGTGGARNAVHRMSSPRATARAMLQVIRDFERNGSAETLRQLNIPELIGRPAVDTFIAIFEVLCPPGGTIDQSITREAMQESIGDMAEAGVGGIDAITSEQLKDFFLNFVARSIEGRVMADIGGRAISLPEDVSAVEYAQEQLHDFVSGATRGMLSGRLDSLEHLSDRDIAAVVDEIYETAFELVAAAGEAQR